jgi:hypothetical protein
MISNSQNVVVALIVLCFGLALLFVLIPYGIAESPYGEVDERVGPEYFPKVIAIGITAGGILLLISAMTGREPSDVDATLPPRVIQGTALTVIYFVLFLLVGYRAATVLSLAGFFWVFGERRVALIVVVSVVLPLGLAWLFDGVFNVRLHDGILF